MASSSQLPDNLLNYFQFKARQKLLLEKENQEWKNFCLQAAPECAACIAEKAKDSEKKDVGIQTFPKRPIRVSEKSSTQTRSQNEHDSEALINILTRMEKIDVALSKLCGEFSDNEKEKEINIQRKSYNPDSLAFSQEQFLKEYEEQRKQLIQKSLRANLQKFPSSQSVLHKKPTAVNKQNSSYLLPHDLQVKRASARRAYLSSLQSKPKVSFKNVNQKPSQSIKTSNEKQNAPTHGPMQKPVKKIVRRKTEKVDEDKVDTLVKELCNDDAKEDPFENVVDGILDDLLGETELELYKIKLQKKEKKMLPNQEATAAVSSSTSSMNKNTNPNFVATDDEKNTTKVKLLIDSKKEMPKEEQREEFLNEPSTNLYEKALESLKDRIAAKKNTVPMPAFKLYEHKTPPKFVCDVTRVIRIDPEKKKNISQQKEEFWRYLENIWQTVEGNINPWIINEMLAETILDECISDVAAELEDLPSIFVQDMYNQEFAQQVGS